MTLNTEEYEELEKSFKTLLKRETPKSKETIKNNVIRTVNAYNNYLFQLEQFNNSKLELRTQAASRLYLINSKLQRVLNLINSTLKVETNFRPLNIEYFATFNYENTTTMATNGTDMTTLAEILSAMQRAEQTRAQTDLQRLENEQTRLQIDKAKQETDFLNAINQQITNKYDGSTKWRQDFLTSCNILKDRAHTPELKKTLFDAVKGKLKGQALACLSEDTTTIEQIIHDLKNNLRTDSMNQIQQKLKVLQIRNMSREKFKERLVYTLEELERSFQAITTDRAFVKNTIMENACSVLSEQTNNVNIHCMIQLEKERVSSPSDLIDHFFIQLDKNNNSQVMSFQHNNRAGYQGNPRYNNGFNSPNNRNNNFNNNFNNRNNNFNTRNNNYNRNTNFDSNFRNNNYGNNTGNNFNNNNYRNNSGNNFNNNNRNNVVNNSNNNNYRNNNNTGNRNPFRSNNNNNGSNDNRNNQRPNRDTRNVHVVNSENFPSQMSHGDMEGY